MSELGIFDTPESYRRLVNAWGDVLDVLPSGTDVTALRGEVSQRAAEIAGQYPTNLRAQIAKDILHNSFQIALNIKLETLAVSPEDFDE